MTIPNDRPFEVSNNPYDPEFLLVDNEEVSREELINEAIRQHDENPNSP